MNTHPTPDRRFVRLAVVTLAAVYFLILVGGIVRASGAGMGCPDWPTCFGQWIPPTDVSQLPANYQEIYADRGYDSMEFNPVKTWTEYVNRLVGVTIGFLILLTLLASLRYFRRDPLVTVYSLAAFVLVGFNGWLGAELVESNLAHSMITIHMVLALLLVGTLILAIARASRHSMAEVDMRPSVLLPGVLVVALLFSGLQVVLGTWVREEVDTIANTLGMDLAFARWAAELGRTFLVHRSFSLAILAVNALLVWLVFRQTAAPQLRRTAIALLGVIGLAIATGAALYYLQIPPVLQPVHLLLAALMFGAQFYLLVAYRHATRVAMETPVVGGAPAAVR